MNKNVILIGLFVLLLVVYFIIKNKKGNMTDNNSLPSAEKLKLISDSLDKLYYKNEQKEYAMKATRALKNAGAPADKIPIMLAQIAHETGHYKNVGSKVDNNISGIKFFNAKVQNATAGSKAPAREGTAPYAHYADLNAWAKDYLRILTSVGKARPLQTNTPEEYAIALGKNGYYEATPAGIKIYTNALKSLTPKFEILAKYA